MFCMLILSLLIPSYSELFLNKTRNDVRIILQTRHGIPNSYVNSTIICGTYIHHILPFFAIHLIAHNYSTILKLSFVACFKLDRLSSNGTDVSRLIMGVRFTSCRKRLWRGSRFTLLELENTFNLCFNFKFNSPRLASTSDHRVEPPHNITHTMPRTPARRWKGQADQQKKDVLPALVENKALRRKTPWVIQNDFTLSVCSI